LEEEVGWMGMAWGSHCCGPWSLQGDHWAWKVMEFRKTIFQAWIVMENSKGHGKAMEKSRIML